MHLHNKLRAESAGAASNQNQVFRQYINFLSKLSSEIPVLIILDDFHWADTSSTNLLFAAARHLAANTVVFLVVYRKDDVERSAGKDDHALFGVRDEMARYSMSREVQIPRADQHDIELLIRAQFPDYVANETLERWLLRITDGNMLFASQVLQTLEHETFLAPGTARLNKDLDTVPVPASARAVISGYIRRLTDDEKDQLRYASVEGETISANMSARFLELPLLKVIAQLRLFAERYHLLDMLGTQSMYATESATYQFVHYLVHKELYDTLEKTERKLLHALAADFLQEELAAAVEAQFNVHGIASRLAAHAAIAERYELAAEALLKGARWVWKSYAADEALRMLEECERAVKTPSKPPAALQSIGLEALLLQGKILQQISRNVESRACFQEAVERTKAVGTPKQRAAAQTGIGIVFCHTNRHSESEAASRLALQIAEEAGDTPSSVTPLCVIGNTYFARIMYAEAKEYYERSIEAARSTGDESGRATPLMNLANVLKIQADETRYMQYYDEALAIFRAERNAAQVALVLLNIASEHVDKGRNEAALESLLEGLQRARTAGDVHREAGLLTAIGTVYANTKRHVEAIDYASKGIALAKSIDKDAYLAAPLIVIGDVYRDTDQFEKALEYFNLAVTHAEAIGDVRDVLRANLFVARIVLLQRKPDEALRLISACLQGSQEIDLHGAVLEAALAHVCCSMILNNADSGDVVRVSRIEILEQTHQLAGDENYKQTIVDMMLDWWRSDLEKCGLVIEG